MTNRNYEGFLPGLHPIEGYGAGGFRFAGMSHRGSLLVSPSGISAISPVAVHELDAGSLALLLNEPRGAVDLLVLGTGQSLIVPPRVLRELLRTAGIGVDPMATGHAVSTYNILLAEGRKVAAVLLAAP
jgi:uncharacterized protein